MQQDSAFKDPAHQPKNKEREKSRIKVKARQIIEWQNVRGVKPLSEGCRTLQDKKA